MTWLGLFSRRNRDAMLHDEVQAHLEMDAADRVARGESPEAAAMHARRDFGNVGLVEELSRDMWASAAADRVMQDVRLGSRMLWRSPVFTVAAALCLGLGVGANAAVFSWMEGILLRPYPGVAAQDRLVAVAGVAKGEPGYADMSWPDFKDLERSSGLFSSFIATKIAGATLTGEQRAERVVGQLVSANFFDALGVRPILGRGFLPEEETGANAHPVAVISYRMWQDRLAGSRDVIGRTIGFNGTPLTVVGVAPEAFVGTFVGYSMQFWVPASMQAVFNGSYMLDDRAARWIEGLARLAPRVTVSQAQAAMTIAANGLATQFADVDRGRTVRVLPLWDAPFDNAKELLPMIRVAFVVSVFVLLIACANVANLLLVRSFARRPEMTVRLALGASRNRLLRQMLVEGALLAIVATGVGLAIAYWAQHALVLFFAPRGGIQLNFSVALDWRVLAITGGVGLTSTLAFALVPALRGTRVDLAGALKADSRSSAGGAGTSRLRAGLVMLQVAISFVLLVGAGLLMTSLQRLRSTNPGFVEDGLFVTRVNLLGAGYDTTRAKTFARDFVNQLQMVGGVASVALARATPFEPSGPFASAPIATDVYRPAPDEQPTANFNSVTPGYFATLGISLVRGRYFTGADADTTAPVSIVSESMAAEFWPNGNPVGARLEVRDRWTQVVGVVKDTKYESLLKPPRPLFYLPMTQAVSLSFGANVKTNRPAAELRPAIAGLLRRLDPNVAPYELLSMREQVERATSTQRIAETFLGVFAGLALLLAAIGLYGVMAYAVTQQRRELGLRMALGAEPYRVLRFVLSRGIALSTAGAAIGVAAAAGTTRLLGDLLYKEGPRDPVVFACALLVMLAAALAACLVPAWRAARTNLVEALRV
jgi:predicted permease